MTPLSSRCMAVALVLGLVAPDAAFAATRRALLIGIDQYRSPDISDLAGCANDVDLMRELLVGKFELAPENVLVLKNGEATRDGIFQAIRKHLIVPTVDGDIAILHFSGHGSQMLDASGDELLDGRDETIVPHDSRLPGVFDISDDDINGLMAELSRKTPHVAFVLDSCHSGSAARAAEVGNRARQAPPDLRPPPPPEAFALGARGIVEGPDDFRLPGSNYVLIAGCRANELSNEAKLGPWSQGALTYFLERALRAAGERATYREVMEQVAADVTARFPKQHPQIEGTGLDTVVFGVESLPPRSYVLVDPDPEDATRAVVGVGEIVGLRQGDTLLVYPPGELRFDDAERATARLTITDVGRLAAGATIDSGTVQARSRARLDLVRPPDFAAGVWLDIADPELKAQLGSGLAEHDSVAVVEDREAAQIRVRTGDGGVIFEGRDLERLDAVAAGDRLAERVVARIAHWARWFAILAIDNPSPDLDFELEVTRVGDPPGISIPAVIPAGTPLELAVTNRSDGPIHLILLDLASDGSASVLYPRAGITEELAPGRRVVLRRVGTSIAGGGDGDLDVVKAIATTTAISADLFELPPVTRSAAPAPRADEGALERFLRRTTQGLTRKLDPLDADGWAVRQTAFRVVPPAVETGGFLAHLESDDSAQRAAERFAATRSVCAAATDAGCFEVEPVPDAPSMMRLRTPQVRSGERTLLSVGAAFEQAYELAREIGAERVEPLLDYPLPFAQTAPHPDAPESRGLGGGDHDKRAEADDRWSLKYTRVPEAWAALAAAGRPVGAEADGVAIAHADTGFRPHPELVGPLWPEGGWDYFGGDADASDELLSGRLLDNPAHGTGSGSAIVSPAGCQLPGAARCPTGAAQGARLVPLRVHRSVVHFSTERMMQAILDASGDDRTRVRADTDLMSISMGGAPSWSLWKAVRKAEQRGYLIVAAAGNYVSTVVWPARFDSTVAVAAVNAGCRPWPHTSVGPAVDFSAPGESVWRGTLSEDGNFVNSMGTGTTYATASTAGIAALWISRHKGNAAFEALKRQGELTRTFRRLVQQTSWQPGAGNVPADARCDDGARWSPSFLGAGIIDAAALLAAPLDGGAPRAPGARSLADLPLWTSLYAAGEPLEIARADYARLFGAGDAAVPEAVAPFEAEITYHYATDEAVAAAIDAVVLGGDRSDSAFGRVRAELGERDLSASLRAALAEPASEEARP